MSIKNDVSFRSYAAAGKINIPLIHHIFFSKTLSDFYDVPTLKPLATSKFERLQSGAIPLDILKHVYESTPDKDRELRDVILQKELKGFPGHAKDGDSTVNYVLEVPDLARDLLKELGKKFISCDDCGTSPITAKECAGCLRKTHANCCRSRRDRWGCGCNHGEVCKGF